MASFIQRQSAADGGLTPDQVRKVLQDWVRQGLTIRVMTDRLREVGVKASKSTVHRWVQEASQAIEQEAVHV